MKKRFLLLQLLLLLAMIGRTQSISSFYYYNGQRTAITLSEKIMFAKFLPGLTNSQKQSIITQANVDLLKVSWDNIPDLVQLRSKVLQKWVWVYPCGLPTGGKTAQSKKDSEKVITQRVPEPCPECLPGCTPYQILQTYDNFYDALLSIISNTNVRSASNALLTSNSDTVATCEDFYIKIKPGYSISDFSSLLSTYSLTATNASADLGPGIYKIEETRVGTRFCIERANTFFETGKCVFSVPNFYEFNVKLSADPLWNQQWGASNTGQYGGTPGADIRLEQAWQISRGNNIKVAVIDEGVQLNHPDLQANLLPGYDATLSGNNGAAGNDLEAHGTNCAGIIGAVADNNIGIAGTAPNCKILSIRALKYDPNISPYLFTTTVTAWQTRAVNWAWQHGADVISCSWKAPIRSDLLEQSIKDAVTLGRAGRGCIVVFSSGNDNISRLNYPASMDEVVAVGAISMCNTRKTESSCDNVTNWGSCYGNELDMVAPGVKIATLTTNGQTISNFGGTSAACPFVSGIAALVLSVNPNLTVAEVKRILYYSCNKVGPYCYNWTAAHPDGAWNIEMGYGRGNAYNAVQLALRSKSFSTPFYNVPQQSNYLFANSAIQFSLINPACSAISSALYFAKRYEVIANISYPNTTNPLIICNSNGWSAANPNDGKNFATAVNVTNTSATLKCWVYAGYNSLGQSIGWFPRAPENVKFNYTIIGANTAITYQTSRSIITDSIVTKAVDFQFDNPGNREDISIDINNSDSKIIIYPNPSNNIAYLSGYFSTNEHIRKIEIIDAMGKKINSIPLTDMSAKVIPININKLKSGVYIIFVYTETKSYSKTIIKP